VNGVSPVGFRSSARDSRWERSRAQRARRRCGEPSVDARHQLHHTGVCGREKCDARPRAAGTRARASRPAVVRSNSARTFVGHVSTTARARLLAIQLRAAGSRPAPPKRLRGAGVVGVGEVARPARRESASTDRGRVRHRSRLGTIRAISKRGGEIGDRDRGDRARRDRSGTLSARAASVAASPSATDQAVSEPCAPARSPSPVPARAHKRTAVRDRGRRSVRREWVLSSAAPARALPGASADLHPGNQAPLHVFARVYKSPGVLSRRRRKRQRRAIRQVHSGGASWDRKRVSPSLSPPVCSLIAGARRR